MQDLGQMSFVAVTTVVTHSHKRDLPLGIRNKFLLSLLSPYKLLPRRRSFQDFRQIFLVTVIAVDTQSPQTPSFPNLRRISFVTVITVNTVNADTYLQDLRQICLCQSSSLTEPRYRAVSFLLLNHLESVIDVDKATAVDLTVTM